MGTEQRWTESSSRWRRICTRRAYVGAKSRLHLERLESRTMLDASPVVDDVIDVHQNASPQTLDVLANDEFGNDYTGERRITSVSYGSQGGTVTLAADRQSVRYAPPADYVGGESFVYIVDGQFPATVQITVQPPLEADSYTIPPDGNERRLDLLANDPFWAGYDGPREITTISVASAGGLVEIAADAKAVMYTPPEGAYGRDEFVYIVDGVYPSRVTISIPDALESDEYELVANTSAALNVLANDPLWPGYSGEGRITHLADEHIQGTVEIAADGQSVHYTPAPNFAGWNSFRYVVDGTYEEYVTLILHRPVQDDYFEVDRNSSDQLFNLTSNDMYQDLDRRFHDVVDRVTAVSQPESGGTATISASGQGVIYTPPHNFFGNDTFTYIADGLHEATVSIDVTRPVRNDYISEGVYQDTPNARLDVLANDFLGNGYVGARRITAITETENGGQVEITADGRSLTYTPAARFVGYDEFTYTVDNDLTATVSLTVQALAQGDHFSFCADPTDVPYLLDVFENDHFHNGYPGPGVITAVGETANGGEVTVAGGGRVLFTPGSTGSDRFVYTVDDQYEASVWVSLTGHLSSDTFVVDQNSASGQLDVLANDFQRNWPNWCSSFAYSGPRQITDVDDSAQGGTVTIAANGRSAQYQPPADFHGRDSFTYTVDGIMQQTVFVNVIRRVRDDQFRVAGESTESLPVQVNDLFGADYTGARQITSVGATTAGGTAVVTADGRGVQYTPPADFVGTDTFIYTVDGALKAEVEVVVEADRDDEFPRFDSLANFQQFLIDDALVRYDHLFGQPAWGWHCLACVDFEFDTFGGAVPMSETRTHSETNVQVEGVDEGDIIEFDADYAYVLTSSEVVIVDAWPAEELSIASTVDIEGNTIAQFLNGDRLTVISQTGGYFGIQPWFDFVGPLAPSPATTFVTVINVTDRTDPTIVQTTSMEGSYVQSRAIDDFVYVLVRNDQAVAPPPLIITEEEPEPEDPDGEDPIVIDPFGPTGVYETQAEYIARNLANLGDMVVAALPNYSSYGPHGELVRTGLLTEPNDILRPLTPDASNLINVVSFDITSNDPGLATTSSVYASGAGTVYASLENFYVFDNDYSAEDGAMTRVMKFDWDGSNGGVDFAATTTVPGTMLNQFSADERDGYLRIATTMSNQGSGNFSGRTENTLIVLQEDVGVFEVVGSLQNLALGESIQSVRYIGDQAFVTTYRQIDPLFGIDLSDPTHPHAVGHLTLPGFSSYMQLISDTHLLTVGKNTPNGFSGPTQVSLFDVSDLTQPQLIDQYTFERFSYSEAELDHHAFGYFAEHGLLAIPTARSYVERIDEDGDGYRETSRWMHEQQLAVLAIDLAHQGATEDGIEWLGEIEHEAAVRRSGYIDDFLFSIGEDAVKVANVADPANVLASIELPQEEPEIPPAEPPVGTDAAFNFSATPARGPLTSSIERAQNHLAKYLGVGRGETLFVASDTSDSLQGRTDIVLRVDDRMYRYQTGDNGTISLVDKDFTFGSAHGNNVWHDIDRPAFARPTDVIDTLATARTAARNWRE